MLSTTRSGSSAGAVALLGAPMLAIGLAGTHVVAPAHSARPSAGYHQLMKAVAHTDQASSAKISFTEKIVTSGKSATSLSLSGEGEVSGLATDRSADVNFTIGGLGAMQMRLVMPDLYAHLPASLQSRLSTSKPWISINLDQLAQAKLGTSLSQLTSGSNEASQTLSELKAASDSVTEVGSATIKGVATTEYKATIDLAKVAGSKLTASGVRQLESMLGSTTLPVEVWVDDNDRVRQVSYDITVHAPASTSGTSGSPSSASVASTIDFFDFGVAVHVSAPPASQVQDITSELLKSSSAG